MDDHLHVPEDKLPVHRDPYPWGALQFVHGWMPVAEFRVGALPSAEVAPGGSGICRGRCGTTRHDAFQVLASKFEAPRLPWMLLHSQIPTGLESFSIVGLEDAKIDEVNGLFNSMVSGDVVELSLVHARRGMLQSLIDAVSVAFPRLRRLHLCHKSIKAPSIKVSDFGFDRKPN